MAQTPPNVLVPAEHSLTANRTRALSPLSGGQQGATSDPRKWMTSAAYVKQKLIPVLIEAPGHMRFMDDGTTRISMLKSLVEVMPTSITGLQAKIDVEFGESKVSNAGEVHHTPTKTSRMQSTPTFVWPEKYGMTIFNYFKDWIIELIADPETTHPGLVNKDAYNGAGQPEFLPDAIAMTVLFIEPSVDLKRVTTAWLCTNMMPKTTGEHEGKRVIGDANEVVEQSIEFTATTQQGDKVLELAQAYLDNLNRQGYKPAALVATYDAVSADVAAGTNGYKDKLQQVGSVVD